jgi:VRR-NUC domain
MSEIKIQSEVLRAIGSLPNVRLFRNTVGSGWLGKVIEHNQQTRTLVLGSAYRVSFGLHVGSSDLIGWRRRVITPDDVGKEFAQFLAVEVKGPKGRTTPEQDTWRVQVNKWGGIAFVTRSAEDAMNILKP